MANDSEGHILVGNTFPFQLIRRPVSITVETPAEFLRHAEGRVVHSFWGHNDTLEAASLYVGLDLTPRRSRAAITLDKDGYPQLDGISFRTCWIVSAVLPERFRPEENKAVGSDRILHWQILRIQW